MSIAQKLFDQYHRKGNSQAETCNQVGQTLRISGKYFYQILTGRVKPGRKLENKMRALHQKRQRQLGKAAYKPRLVISYDNREDMENYSTLTNEERILALAYYKAFLKKKGP